MRTILITLALTLTTSTAFGQFKNPIRAITDPITDAGKRLENSGRTELGRGSEYLRDRRIAPPRETDNSIGFVPEQKRVVRGYVSIRNTTGRTVSFQVRSGRHMILKTMGSSAAFIRREKLYGNDRIRFDRLPYVAGYQAKSYRVFANQTITFSMGTNGEVVLSSPGGYATPKAHPQKGNTTFLKQNKIVKPVQQPKRDNTADAISAGIGLLGELLKNAEQREQRAPRERRRRN